MTLNKESILKIRESVDIYRTIISPEQEKIQFYRINTREKLSIFGGRDISQLLSALDGVSTLEAILARLNLEVDSEELFELLAFLKEQGLIVERAAYSPANDLVSIRYDRQLNFIGDWLKDGDALSAQKNLAEKKVAIFGVGAIGGTIAIALARAGIKKFVLIDPKKVSNSDRMRHYYFNKKHIGKYKTESLSNYLQRVASDIDVSIFNEKLLPNTNLSSMIDSVDLAVNCADEPYIGHTTLKLGRALWEMKTPMYVGGGFDAHLMSTGEFIIPGMTACADCYSNTFRLALKNWKPIYVVHQSSSAIEKSNVDDGLIDGGPGGCSAMSLFSASYAGMQILRYLCGIKDGVSTFSVRGEYLFNQGKMTKVSLVKQGECRVCS